MKTQVCHVCKVRKPIAQFEKDNNSKGGHRKQCKECRHAQKQAYYATPEGRALRQEARRRYKKAHPERVRAWRKSRRINLANCFVRERILRHCQGLTGADIPQELIDLKRQMILLNRELKQQKG